MSHSLSPSQIGPFAERFEPLQVLFRDSGFLDLLVREKHDHKEMHLQVLARPGLHRDEFLQPQWEAIKAVKNDLWCRPQEFVVEGNWGGLISWVPPGRTLSQVEGTFHDEVYLEWLAEALQDLHHLHQQGLLHLAQNENSWLFFKPDMEEGEESLGLSDLRVFADNPIGERVTSPVLLAVAPEILEGKEVDARADLYSLACLILLQRAPHFWERLNTLPKLIDAHRAGRLEELVPKTHSVLNDLLRRLLQVRPEDRPAGAAEVLKLISKQKIFRSPHSHLGENFSGKDKTPSPELPLWAQERIQRRQANVVLSTLYSLIREGEEKFALGWIEEISERIKAPYQPYLHYLQALAHRRLRQPDLAKKFREKTIANLPERQDKKLQVLLLLEEGRSLAPQENGTQIQQLLDHALSLAKNYPDLDLQAKVLVERAKLFKNLRQDEKSLEDLQEAERLTGGLERCLVRGKILRDLADLFSQNGLLREALPLAEEALREVEGDPAEQARRQLEVGLILMKLGNAEAASSHLYEGKYLFSTLKDLGDLVWATCHEIHSFLAQGDFKKVRKELKALRRRARLLEANQEFLDMLELILWLETGEGVDPNSLPLLTRIQKRFAEIKPENVFRDIAWAPADSYRLFERFFHKMGHKPEAELCGQRAEELSRKVQEKLVSLGLLEKYTSSLGPEIQIPEVKTQGAEGAPLEQIREWQRTQAQLQEENRTQRLEIQRLQKELAEARRKIPSVTLPATGVRVKLSASAQEESGLAPYHAGELAQAREEIEKQSIEAALRRHQGNRSETAKELNIHRRTLFEKIHKYGLDHISFEPSREEVLRAIEECQGKKNLAAEKLGLSRSSFYRRLKELGIG